MLKTRFGWTILLLALAVAGGGWIALSQETTVAFNNIEGLVEAPAVGYLAPDFTLETTLGETLRLNSLRGQPVVLNFWATWCPPCRAEMPAFQRASVKYNGQAVILGIDQGEPLAVVTDFANAIGVGYPVLLDLDNAVSRAYSVAALPQTFFLDANGVIREAYTGVINQAVLEDRIERLLSEAGPAQINAPTVRQP